MPEHSMKIGLSYNFDQSSLNNIEQSTRSVNQETEKLAKNFKDAEKAAQSYQKTISKNSSASSQMVQQSKAYIDAEKRLYQSNISTRQEYYDAIQKKATQTYNEILNLSKQGVSADSKQMQEKLAIWNNYNKARKEIEKEINDEINKINQQKVQQDKENIKIETNLAKQAAQEKLQAEKQFAQQRLNNEKQISSQLQAEDKQRADVAKRSISEQVSYNQKQLNSLISQYKQVNAQVINMANSTKTSFSGKMFNSMLSYGVVQQVTNAFMQLGQAIVDVNYNVINNQRLMENMTTGLRDKLINSASEIAKSTGIQITDAQKIQGAWIRINDAYSHSADLLNDITGLTAKFMNVGEITDAEQAVSLLNASLLQFNVGATDAVAKSEEFLSKWAKMADITAMGTADEYGEAISQYGASLKNLGGDMDDAIAQASVLADRLAMNGKEAGTALKTFNVYLSRDKTLKLFEGISKELGDTSYKLTDNNGKLKEYRDLLGTVAKAYKHYKDAGNDVMANKVLDAVGATRRRDAALAMMNAVNDTSDKGYDAYVSKSKNVDTNYLTKQNELLMKSLRNQWNALVVSMQQAAIGLGNAGLLEGITTLIHGANDAFTAFSKLPQPIKQFASSLLMIGTAMAGVSKLNEITGIGEKISSVFNSGTQGSKEYAASVAQITQEFVKNSQNSLQSVSAVEKHTQAYAQAQNATTSYVENLTNLDKAYANGTINAQQYSDRTKELTASYQEEMTTIRQAAESQVQVAEAQLTAAQSSVDLANSNKQVAEEQVRTASTAQEKAMAQRQLLQADNQCAQANARLVTAENNLKNAQKGVEATTKLESNALKSGANAKKQYASAEQQSSLKTKLSLTTLKQKMAVLVGVKGAETMAAASTKSFTIAEIASAAASKIASGAVSLLSATLGMLFSPITIITVALAGLTAIFGASKSRVEEYDTKLQDLGSELDETKSKIEELKNAESQQGGLSETQAEDLKALQTKKQMLEEQIKLTKTLKANEEFLNHQGGFLGFGGEDSGLEKAKDAVKTFEQMNNQVKTTKDAYDAWSQAVKNNEKEKSNAYTESKRQLAASANSYDKAMQKQLSAANEVVKQYTELQRLTGQGAYAKDGAILSGSALKQAKAQLNDMGDSYSKARALVSDWAQKHNVSVESATQAIEDYNAQLEETKSAVSQLKGASDGLKEALNLQSENGVLTMEQTYDLMTKMGDKGPMLAGALEKCEGGYRLNAKAQEVLNELMGDGNDEMQEAIDLLLGGVDAAIDNADAKGANSDKVKENTEALDANNKKAKENAEELTKLQQKVKDVGGEPIVIDVDTSKPKECQKGIDEIKQKIQDINDNDKISPEVKDAQVKNLEQQLENVARKKVELEEPAFMKLNVDNVDTNVQAALAKIQEYQQAVDNVNILQITGADTTEAQKKVDTLATDIKNLPKEQKVAIGLQGKDEAELSIEDIKNRISEGKVKFPVSADTDEAEKKTSKVKKNIEAIHDKSAKINVVVNGISDIKLLKDALSNLKDKKVNVNAHVTGESNAKTLKTAIDGVSNKKVDVGANISGLSGVNNLIGAIRKLTNKTVKAQAKTSGTQEVKSLHKAMNNLSNKLVNAIAAVSGLMQVYALKSAIASLRSKTINITTHVRHINNVNGNANVNGMANASGTWGARESGISLVGELGRELVVRGNSWFTVGDDGAEFTAVRKGDIIFNHVQTKEILEHGHVTSGGGRGRALAQGNAFLNGVAYAEGSKYSSSYKITDDYNVANTKAVQRYAREAERLIAQAVAAGESISDSLREAAKKAEEAAKNVESFTSKYISNVESMQKRAANALKDHYQLEYDERKKLLEKEHNAKLDAIDEEIAKLKGETTEDKEKQLAELQAQLDRWKNDNSTLGKKKQQDLQKQIESLDKEIKIDKLEKQRDEENDKYDKSIDKDSDTYDSILKDLENKMTDENLYKTVNQLIRKGDTDTLSKLLTEHDSQWDGWKTLQGQTAGQIIQGEVKDAINNYKDVIGGYIDENGGIYTRGGQPNITVSGGSVQPSTPKAIGVGTQINAGRAPIYAYAGSTSGMGQYFSSDPIYTVIGEQGDYVLARWHKLSSGATGWFKKSEVTAMKTGGYTGNSEGMALLHAKERVLNAEQTKAFENLVYNIIPKIPTKFMNTGSSIENNSTVNHNTTFNKELVKVEVGTVVNNTPYDIQNSEDNMDRMFRRSLRKSGITLKK